MKIINIIKNLKSFDKYYRVNNIKLNIYTEQFGDGTLIFNYKDHKIKFKKYKDENNNIELYLKTIDKNDNCIVITIDNNSNVGYISSINSIFGKCLAQKELNNNGITYIKISIELLKKYKSEFKINKIMLSDDALFYYNKNTKINLSKLNFLQYNESYYGRFGFVPSNENDKRNYISNQKILLKLKTKKINLIKILENYKYDINNSLKNKLLNKFDKYKNKKLTYWFNKISRKLSLENCNLLSFLIDEIFFELKLYPISNIFYEMIL